MPASVVRRRPRTLVYTSACVNDARKAIVGHKHLIGCGFTVAEILAAISVLRGAHDDQYAGTHIARNEAIQLAPLFADGEPGAVIVARAGGAINRPKATEF